MRVQALIDQFGLRNTAKTVIDDEGHRGLSSGERQRVSIGINIIHDLIILFLNELTLDLDSISTFIMVEVLHAAEHTLWRRIYGIEIGDSTATPGGMGGKGGGGGREGGTASPHQKL